jgi:hypothetical protein
MIEARTTVNDVHGAPSNLANKRWPCQRTDNRTGTIQNHQRGVTEKYPAPKLKPASAGTFWISSLG